LPLVFFMKKDRNVAYKLSFKDLYHKRLANFLIAINS
jgi:hypothetical protein